MGRCEDNVKLNSCIRLISLIVCKIALKFSVTVVIVAILVKLSETEAYNHKCGRWLVYKTASAKDAIIGYLRKTSNTYCVVVSTSTQQLEKPTPRQETTHDKRDQRLIIHDLK